MNIEVCSLPLLEPGVGINPYERHIGATYYIGSRFRYESMENDGRPIKRLIESIGIYHGMDNYKFDKYGNLYNEILYAVLGGVEISRLHTSGLRES